MIARALIGKPQVLIFDEATSALDNVSPGGGDGVAQPAACDADRDRAPALDHPRRRQDLRDGPRPPAGIRAASTNSMATNGAAAAWPAANCSERGERGHAQGALHPGTAQRCRYPMAGRTWPARAMRDGEIVIQRRPADRRPLPQSSKALAVTAGDGVEVARLGAGEFVRRDFLRRFRAAFRPRSRASANASVLEIKRTRDPAQAQRKMSASPARFHRGRSPSSWPIACAPPIGASAMASRAISSNALEGELDMTVLDTVAQAGDRFNRLLGMLAAAADQPSCLQEPTQGATDSGKRARRAGRPGSARRSARQCRAASPGTSSRCFASSISSSAVLTRST